MPRLVRNEPGLDAFALEKSQHEVADFIVADGGQERGSETEPSHADGDIGRAPADVSVEAGHFRHRHADLVRVQID